jgi:NAD-dependent dihydropyrimidine dehydrogenase PreA subunit
MAYGGNQPWLSEGHPLRESQFQNPRGLSEVSGGNMAYVIAEPCIGTKDTACVDVCPVDCIHPRKDEANFADATQLYIDPAECIDCGACVPVCPVTAIFPLEDLPDKWKEYTEINSKYYNR